MVSLNAFAIDFPGITEAGNAAGRFSLIKGGVPVAVVADPADEPGVLIAAETLREDFARVCGRKAPAAGSRAIIAGTVGSPLIGRLVADGVIDVSTLKGQYETYVIATVGGAVQGYEDALVIAGADIDALIVDAFSNPSIEQIEERLFPFIETVQAAHPDIPIIFQRTIYRENRNFNMASEKKEQARIDRSVALVKEAQKKYKNIYLIYPDATSPRHDTSVDGVHPGDYGYWLWAQSIEKPVLKILRKYGIK